MSIDLDSELEKRHFLIPDGFMLFYNWEKTRDSMRASAKEHPWETKINKVFWRGMDSGDNKYVDNVWADIANYYPRVYLVKLSGEHPHLIDAKIVGGYPET